MHGLTKTANRYHLNQGPEKGGSNWRDDDNWKTSALGKRKVISEKNLFLYPCAMFLQFLITLRTDINATDLAHIVYRAPSQCSEVVELLNYQFSRESFRFLWSSRLKKPWRRIINLNFFRPKSSLESSWVESSGDTALRTVGAENFSAF